jgi:ABC-type molybdate transport system ATPase subunit
LSAIAGLIAPQRGTIMLGSEVLFSATDRIDLPPHKRGIGYVFQDLALWPHLTALAQVRLVGQSVGLDVAGAIALLDSVGLGRMTSRLPGLWRASRRFSCWTNRFRQSIERRGSRCTV